MSADFGRAFLVGNHALLRLEDQFFDIDINMKNNDPMSHMPKIDNNRD